MFKTNGVFYHEVVRWLRPKRIAGLVCVFLFILAVTGANLSQRNWGDTAEEIARIDQERRGDAGLVLLCIECVLLSVVVAGNLINGFRMMNAQRCEMFFETMPLTPMQKFWGYLFGRSMGLIALAGAVGLIGTLLALAKFPISQIMQIHLWAIAGFFAFGAIGLAIGARNRVNGLVTLLLLAGIVLAGIGATGEILDNSTRNSSQLEQIAGAALPPAAPWLLTEGAFVETQCTFFSVDIPWMVVILALAAYGTLLGLSSAIAAMARPARPPIHMWKIVCYHLVGLVVAVGLIVPEVEKHFTYEGYRILLASYWFLLALLGALTLPESNRLAEWFAVHRLRQLPKAMFHDSRVGGILPIMLLWCVAFGAILLMPDPRPGTVYIMGEYTKITPAMAMHTNWLFFITGGLSLLSVFLFNQWLRIFTPTKHAAVFVSILVGIPILAAVMDKELLQATWIGWLAFVADRAHDVDVQAPIIVVMSIITTCVTGGLLIVAVGPLCRAKQRGLDDSGASDSNP